MDGLPTIDIVRQFRTRRRPMPLPDRPESARGSSRLAGENKLSRRRKVHELPMAVDTTREHRIITFRNLLPDIWIDVPDGRSQYAGRPTGLGRNRGWSGRGAATFLPAATQCGVLSSSAISTAISWPRESRFFSENVSLCGRIGFSWLPCTKSMQPDSTVEGESAIQAVT